MIQQNSPKRIIIYCFLLLLFLCAMPAISQAVPNKLPKPDQQKTVSAGTTVQQLKSIFQINNGLQLTVWKSDGTVRADGCLETGDLAEIDDQNGNLLECLELIVAGSPAESSSPPDSRPESSLPPNPGSSEEPGPVPSVPEGSESSERPVNPQPPVPEEIFVLEQPVSVQNVWSALGFDGSDGSIQITVTSNRGIRRMSGLVCTGDTVTVQNAKGQILHIIPVAVLGDLTRSGKVTKAGCSRLYGWLTGQNNLSSDLLLAADMNQDGKVDPADLLAMKKELRFGVSTSKPETASRSDH